ncbi:hypothetical protein I8751_13700 [Nostocaceae cyanobacterium CENA357]|uniref:Uncharacterized protein n=1 Tax=Atlanticothrix silvestris CENA357 TaxID=1725252 RepID=A0A8J7HHX6_9CYAN|nr:hypothetical protein [Atlanticothrix silvestris CENA357]
MEVPLQLGVSIGTNGWSQWIASITKTPGVHSLLPGKGGVSIGMGIKQSGTKREPFT